MAIIKMKVNWKKYWDFEVDDDKKNGYLNAMSSANESTFKRILSTLKRVDEYESQIERSLEDMGGLQIDGFFSSVIATSRSTLEGIATILKGYLLYCNYEQVYKVGHLYLVNNVTAENVDPETGKDYFERMMDSNAITDKILTYGEYNKILDDKKGDLADICLFIMLWHGVKGKDYENIIHAEYNDINFDNGLCVFKDGTSTTFNKKELKIFKDAQKKSYYIGKDTNGENTKRPYAMKDGKFLNPRIIKTYPSKKSDGIELLNSATVKKRIKDYSIFALGNIYLTGVAIESSGKLYNILKHFDYTIPSWSDCNKYAIDNNITINKGRLNKTLENVRDKMIELGEIEIDEETGEVIKVNLPD